MATSASRYSNWLQRTHPYTSSSFRPNLNDLSMVVLRSGPANPEGFTLAMFKTEDPETNVVVDAMGRLFVMNKEDYSGITSIGHKCGTSLPDTGNWRNTWKVKQARTGQPIDRVFVNVDTGNQHTLKEISVQGFEEGNWALKEKYGEYEELPESLREMISLVREARDGYDEDEVDEDTVDMVKALLGDKL